MQPLIFEPYLRPQIWGGRRLANRLGKALPSDRAYGESWEISGHPHHVSRVSEGSLTGTTLTTLCETSWDRLFGEWEKAAGESRSTVATNAPLDKPPPRFPLLIKYLDCHEQLSVQVHPNDELAGEFLEGERGKTEAWIVLEAEPTARIYAGLKSGTTPNDLVRHLDRGTVSECLHSFVPEPGDCVFLEAGTVHAVGGGVLMAEVQQSSDATFRLFDWNRLGTDGKPRQLHREESLRSINWSAGPVFPVQGESIEGLPASIRGEHLVRCPYFLMGRFFISAGSSLPIATGFSIWMVLDGAAELIGPQTGYRRAYVRGETVLIPAAAGECCWQTLGNGQSATLLRVQVPGR